MINISKINQNVNEMTNIQIGQSFVFLLLF